MSDRQLLLVVGIGRSGTSLFTGIVGAARSARASRRWRADDTNPRGFGEPRWVVDFHTRLMQAPENHRVQLTPGCLGARR